ARPCSRGAGRRPPAAARARAQAEARAAPESRRRLLPMALAASVLAIVALAGGGWARRVHDQVARAEATSLAVSEALDDAVKKRGLARSTPGAGPTLWVEAIEAARRAGAPLDPGGSRPALRRPVPD